MVFSFLAGLAIQQARLDRGLLKPICEKGGDLARLPADTKDYEAISQELQGTWCLASESGYCFNFADYFAESPQSGFDRSLELEFPKTQPSTHVLCLGFDSEYNGDPTCSTAASAFFTNFPAGVSWDCLAGGAARFGFTACSPDYTAAHRTAPMNLGW